MNTYFDEILRAEVPVYCADCVCYEHMCSLNTIGCSFKHRKKNNIWQCIYVEEVEEITAVHIAKCKLLGNKLITHRLVTG